MPIFFSPGVWILKDSWVACSCFSLKVHSLGLFLPGFALWWVFYELTGKVCSIILAVCLALSINGIPRSLITSWPTPSSEQEEIRTWLWRPSLQHPRLMGPLMWNHNPDFQSGLPHISHIDLKENKKRHFFKATYADD